MNLGSFSNGGLGFGLAFTLEDEFSSTSRDIERSLDSLDGTASVVAANIDKSLNQMRLGATAVAAGALLLAPFLLTLNEASDLQESLSKATVVFGDHLAGVTEFVDKSSLSYGQSKHQALELISTYGNLFTALGMGRQAAAEYSISLNKLVSDLASFNNASIDSVGQAIRSAMTGEFEAVKKYGISINQDLLKARAVQMGLIDTTKAKLSPLVKMQAAYAIVMEQTANAQGDFIRTSDGYANSLRIQEASWENLKAIIGGVMLPVMTRVRQLITRITDAFAAMLDTKIGMFIGRVVAGLGALLVVGGTALVLVGGMRFAVFGLANAFTGATKATIVQTIAQKGLIAGLRATATAAWATIVPLLPYIAIGAAIAAPFIILYKVLTNASAAFRDFEAPATGTLLFLQRLGGYTAMIREVWKSWDGLTNTFSISNTMRDKLDSLGILDSAVNLGTWVVRVKSFFSGMSTGFSKAWAAIKRIGDIFDPVLTKIGDLLEKVGLNIGRNTSDIDKWAKAGEIAAYIIVGSVVAIAASFVGMGIAAVIAMWPIIAVIGLIGVAIWGVMKIASKWDEWMAGVSQWGTTMWNAGVSFVDNLWNGMKSKMSSFLSWIDESISNIPLIGEFYELNKFAVKSAAYMGGELYSYASGEENPVAAPDLADIGIDSAKFEGRNMAMQMAAPTVNVSQAPVVVHSNVHLDGDIIAKNMEERANFDNSRE